MIQKYKKSPTEKLESYIGTLKILVSNNTDNTKTLCLKRGFLISIW
jgi:hypothetical protein